MAGDAILSLARVEASELEALWRRVCALPAKARVVEEHVPDGALRGALEPMLGQPAWVVASLLEAVLAERGSFSPVVDRGSERAAPVFHYTIEQHLGTSSPELVWTGDVSSRVPVRRTRYVIEELFDRASRSVLIAGYSFDKSSDLFDPLFDRAQQLSAEGKPLPTVRVVLDCSRTKRAHGESAHALAQRVAEQFRETCWRRDTLTPEILYHAPSAERNDRGWALVSMHAKCIVVDGEIALVGSANFSKRARDRNLEVGALIRDHHFVQSLLAAWEDVEDELVAVADQSEHRYSAP